MSFWMVNYVCSLVLWDNLVCVFYVFFFIFHFTRRPMSFMSVWTHALGVNLDAPEIAETLFSKKQHGLLNLLCFCVVRVTSDRKCLWQYQLECKMGEGLNHLTERRRICIESCLLISHPRHQLPCHFVDGRLKTLLRAWASRVPCWLSIIKIFHDCRRCNDVVCMVKALPALETQIRSKFDNSLQVKRHVRFERLGDDLHSVKSQAVQAFYLRWRSETLRNLTVLWCLQNCHQRLWRWVFPMHFLES